MFYYVERIFHLFGVHCVSGINILVSTGMKENCEGKVDIVETGHVNSISCMSLIRGTGVFGVN